MGKTEGWKEDAHLHGIFFSCHKADVDASKKCKLKKIAKGTNKKLPGVKCSRSGLSESRSCAMKPMTKSEFSSAIFTVSTEANIKIYQQS